MFNRPDQFRVSLSPWTILPFIESPTFKTEELPDHYQTLVRTILLLIHHVFWTTAFGFVFFFKQKCCKFPKNTVTKYTNWVDQKNRKSLSDSSGSPRSPELTWQGRALSEGSRGPAPCFFPASGGVGYPWGLLARKCLTPVSPSIFASPSGSVYVGTSLFL